MVLRRVGVLSAGKIIGAVGASVGLFIGAVMSIAALMGAAINVGGQPGQPQLPMMIAGAGAIIFLPIIYGVMCFISGIIYAAIYNLIAGFVGGIEMDFDTLPPQ